MKPRGTHWTVGLVLALCLAWSGAPAGANTPAVDTLTFGTHQSQITPGTDNQGWWTNYSGGTDTNDNYTVGAGPTGDGHRNFFTFDLSALDRPVVRATLVLPRYGTNGEAVETLVLYDVATDVFVLNDNFGQNLAIFEDLGTGTAYGSFEIRTGGPHHGLLRLELNAEGVEAINAAAGGWFSIGGRLATSQSHDDLLFGGSGGPGPQVLIVQLG